MLEKENWKIRQQERKQHFDKIRKQVMSIREKGSLEGLFDTLWSWDVIKNKNWFINERILKKATVDKMAQELNKLTDEKCKTNERPLTLPGMHHATTTEILHAFYQGKYPIWNKRSEDLIGALDEEFKMPRTSDEWKKYTYFISRVGKISKKFQNWKKEVEEELGEKIPDYEFFDAIASQYRDGEIGFDEIIEQITPSESPVIGIEEPNRALSLTLLNLIISMERHDKEPEQIVQKLKSVLNEFAV